MDRLVALERLNIDKNYEDQLAFDLTEFYISCIDSIDDLSNYQKEQLKLKLKIIADYHQLQYNLIFFPIQYFQE